MLYLKGVLIAGTKNDQGMTPVDLAQHRGYYEVADHVTNYKCLTTSEFQDTVEPLNKGHIGSSLFVLYREVVLCSEAN